MIFFDSDCISSFLWIRRADLFLRLNLGELILPQEVFLELSNPSIPHIGKQMKELINGGQMKTIGIMTGTKEATLFYEMTGTPAGGFRPIGRGEAAALALAKVYNGTIASNNLRDVSAYSKRYQIRHITTGYILAQALEKGLIDEKEGNQIWSNMLSRRRRLRTKTFTAYLCCLYCEDQMAASCDRE